MPEVMAEAAGRPGWPGRRIRTDGSCAACAGDAGPSQAPTSTSVTNHASRRGLDRTARHFNKGPAASDLRPKSYAAESLFVAAGLAVGVAATPGVGVVSQ